MLVALTRAVPASLQACELTHLQRHPMDVGVARAQHAEYEQALADLGCRVLRLPDAPDLPDSVFVEDTAVVVDELAVLTRPGAASRRPEVESMREALAPHRPLAAIEAPGTLDGGDVLRVGRRVFAGRGSRTDDEGIRQLASLLSPFGYAVTAVPFTGCLHLKTAVTQVADDRVLLNPDWVSPAAFTGIGHVAVDPAEPLAANVLMLGGICLCAAAFPRTAARLRAEGLDLRLLEASELAKAEGGLTCGSVIFRVLEVGLEGLEPSTNRL